MNMMPRVYRNNVTVLKARYLVVYDGDEELDRRLERHALQKWRLDEEKHLAERSRRNGRWTVCIADECGQAQSDLFKC